MHIELFDMNLPRTGDLLLASHTISTREEVFLCI